MNSFFWNKQKGSLVASMLLVTEAKATIVHHLCDSCHLWTSNNQM